MPHIRLITLRLPANLASLFAEQGTRARRDLADSPPPSRFKAASGSGFGQPAPITMNDQL
jgi:hypothetical protein